MDWTQLVFGFFLAGFVGLAYFRCNKIQARADFFETMSQWAQSTYFEYDLRAKRIKISPALIALYQTGDCAAQLESDPASAIIMGAIHPEDGIKCQTLFQDLREGKMTQGILQLRVLEQSSGAYLWSELTVNSLPHRWGQPRRAVGILTDLHYTDKLTGIDNKHKFELNATALLTQKREDLAFVLFDLKDFKLYNQINGFAEGDLLLKHMAQVLAKNTQAEELCAHSFSDRFFMIVAYADLQSLEQRIHEIVQAVAAYHTPNATRYTILPYVGVCCIKGELLSVDSMVDRARIAQLRARNTELYPIGFFDDQIKDTVFRRWEIENSMEESLRRQQFVVYLQPKYHLASNCIAGAEALVRWQKGSTLIPPGEFIPLFEKNGFITKLDWSVFEEVCRIQRGWIDRGLVAVPVSVNFSRLHIYNAGFVEQLTRIADQWQIPHALLEVEVTETIAFENEQVLSQFIGELAQNGFLTSIDDFGSGYSSLGMLKNLPFDIIKLDRSFFGVYSDADRARAVVGNVIALSHQLGIITVAEGVETESDVALLRSLGCDLVQGYYFARPMPSATFTEMLDPAH